MEQSDRILGSIARDQAVLTAATAEAEEVGLAYITRDAVAKRAGIPPGSMCMFGSMDDIKREVAVARPDLANGELSRYEASKAATDEAILTACLQLAETHRYDRLTRQQVADRAGVSAGRVSLFGGDMIAIRDVIMNAAVKAGNQTIIAQGLADRHAVALAAPEELRQAAIASLGSGGVDRA